MFGNNWKLLRAGLLAGSLLAGSIAFAQVAPPAAAPTPATAARGGRRGQPAPTPVPVPPEVLKAAIRTPPTPETPRVNGPTIFGVRPGSPFLYKIPATGKKPIQYSAKDLPAGLQVNAETGVITGKLGEAGEKVVTLVAKNDLGTAEKKFKIVVGETIALTPPLGWNSWNVWGGQVRGEYVLAAAKSFVDTGLIDHGWTYINIDDAWQAAKRGGKFNAIQPNDKFPDFEKMCTQIHEMGLKLGIYSTPVRTSYAGYIGGSSDSPDGAWARNAGRRRGAAAPTPTPTPTPATVDLASIPADARPALSVAYGTNPRVGPAPLGKYTFAANDAKQFAAWGVDYLKYDWNPNQYAEVKEMTDALRASGRDIFYSLSNSMPFQNIAQIGPVVNSWRTTGDIRDNWGSMARQGFDTDRWAQYASPGHWNDPDMMVVGFVGWGTPHPCGLTPDEQFTHVTLWALVDSPMLLGCDLTKMDEFTKSLLTNDEVLAVSQDALGKPAVTVNKIEPPAATPTPAATPAGQMGARGRGRFTPLTGVRVYAKPLEDGTMAVGLFNLDAAPAKVTAKWSDLKLSGSQKVRDLWRQKDLGPAEGQFEMTVAPHGAELLKIGTAK